MMVALKSLAVWNSAVMQFDARLSNRLTCQQTC